MNFREATSGLVLYIFDRDELTLDTDKIVSIVPPHFDPNLAAGKMAVDITTTRGKKYTIDESLTTAYFANCAISLDKTSILREIEAYKTTSENILKEIPRHEKIVDECTRLIVDNDPSLKEKRENEERFGKIESSICELKDLFSDFIKKLS